MTNNEKNAASTSASAAATQAAAPLEIKHKVRVLCLHGYRQNGDAFKSKLGSFRKHVAKYAEFVFITAPNEATPLEPNATVEPDQRSWWANKDDGSFKGTNKDGPAYGFEKSLRLVEEVWKTQGPFQGLLGFSQGACFAGLLCCLRKKKLTSVDPQFAILSSGFTSGSLAHRNAYTERVTIPTLQIYGLSDEIIPKEMSQELALYFRNSDILEHEGGHYFPATGKQKQTYVNFFQDRLQEYLEALELKNGDHALAIDEEQEEKEDVVSSTNESD